MRLAAIAGAMAVFAGMSIAPKAHAWVNIKNTTGCTVWAAQARNNIDTFYCGEYDGCGNSGEWGFRVTGWYVIQPGATVRVNNDDWSHMQYYLYAYNQCGREWKDGNGNYRFSVQNSAFDFCNYESGNSRPFWQVKMGHCCGQLCPDSPNATIVL